MEGNQSVQELADKVIQELESIQSVYTEENVTDAKVEILTVPKYKLSEVIAAKIPPPSQMATDSKYKKKVKTAPLEKELD